MNMPIEKAIDLMRVERECVLRQDTDLCNRDECGCQCCDLVQDADEIIEAYDIAIDCIEFALKYTESLVECMTKLGCETIEDFQKFLKGGVTDG